MKLRPLMNPSVTQAIESMVSIIIPSLKEIDLHASQYYDLSLL